MLTRLRLDRRIDQWLDEDHVLRLGQVEPV